MGYDSILYEQVDDIVKIMMNRPEKANAQDFHMSLLQNSWPELLLITLALDY